MSANKYAIVLACVAACVLLAIISPANADCVYDGCECWPGTPQGEYCLGDNVYECSPDGSCCNYGYRDSCAQCGALRCKRSVRGFMKDTDTGVKSAPGLQ